MLKDLDFVAVGVSDEGHLFAVDEFLAPVGGPEMDGQAVGFKAFEHVAVGVDVVHTDAGMDKVLGKLDLEVGRVSELELVVAAGDGEMSELVAAGGFVGSAQDFKATGAAIPVNRLFKVGNANTGMIEGDGHTRFVPKQ